MSKQTARREAAEAVAVPLAPPAVEAIAEPLGPPAIEAIAVRDDEPDDDQDEEQTEGICNQDTPVSGGKTGVQTSGTNGAAVPSDTHTAPAAPTIVAKSKFLTFEKAQLYVCSLNLKSQRKWREWAKSAARPTNIPSNPGKTYKREGWHGYGHWLGGIVGDREKHFLSFKKALVYARSLKLANYIEWQAWHKSTLRPANIPSAPDKVYKDHGWQGMGHWLGTGKIAPQKQTFLPFEEALLYARSLKLKRCEDWNLWRKSGARPANIPSTPDATYKHKGWQGYKHWLGTRMVTESSKK